MTSPGGLGVDPGQLRQIGQDVQSIAAQLSSALNGHEHDAQPAGKGDGWDAWRAMVAVCGQWVNELHAVSAEMGGVGEQLVAAADAYDQADHGSADAFRGAHPQ